MYKKSYPLIISIFIGYGCSSIGGNSNIAPGYSDAFKLVKNYFYGEENNFLNRQLINDIPYASMKLKIGKGSTGLVILEEKIQNKEYWVSADSVFIVINNGRIIQTSGLENNLTDSTSSEIPLNVENSYSYLNNYDKPRLDSFKLDATLTKKQTQSVELINGKKDLTLFVEVVKNDFVGWQVTNKYWLDQDGFVWKSVQYISPKLPPIYIEVTKKPS